MTLTSGLVLVILSVACFIVALAALAFDAKDPNIYLGCMAAGGALGFLGLKLP